MEATCETCPYYEDADEECRKESPFPGPSGEPVFPIMPPDEWCADHPLRAGHDVALAAFTAILGNAKVIPVREHIARDAHMTGAAFMAERERRMAA